MLLATVVNDSHKQNKGQNFAIKLKDSGSYQIGEIIDFDKLTLKTVMRAFGLIAVAMFKFH